MIAGARPGTFRVYGFPPARERRACCYEGAYPACASGLPSIVITGLDPVIHSLAAGMNATWMPGSGPGMKIKGKGEGRSNP